MRVLVLHHLRLAVPALGDEIGRVREVGFNYGLQVSGCYVWCSRFLSDALASTDRVPGGANDGISWDRKTANDGASGRCLSQSACRQAWVQAEGFVDHAI